MALKDLLVHLDQSHRASTRSRLAADLARRHDSWLTAVYVREMSPAQFHAQSASELGLGSATALERAHRLVERSIDDAADRLRGELHELERNLPIKGEWRCLDGIGAEIVPQHARLADLSVVSQDIPATNAAGEYTFSEQLLFMSGGPVIFIPAEGHFNSLGRHVLVAWNSSRPAARAVNDALPLIECADQVTVLAVNPEHYAPRAAALSPERMVEHLTRHRATIEGRSLRDVPTSSIAEALQSEALKVGADLIVAGAFGHPKLWEKLLGGVTRDLLRDMRLPVLMSY